MHPPSIIWSCFFGCSAKKPCLLSSWSQCRSILPTLNFRKMGPKNGSKSYQKQEALHEPGLLRINFQNAPGI